MALFLLSIVEDDEQYTEDRLNSAKLLRKITNNEIEYLDVVGTDYKPEDNPF